MISNRGLVCVIAGLALSACSSGDPVLMNLGRDSGPGAG